jgi:hypothetical protein
MLPVIVAAGVVLVPFLIWDAGSFFDDTVSYVIGTSASSFPLKGWGLSTLLLAAGVIPTAESPFPFGLLEVGLGIPVLGFLLWRQWRNNTLSNVWLGFAVFSFVVEYVSRFFNDNYFTFVIQSFLIALFVQPLSWTNASTPQAETETQ